MAAGMVLGAVGEGAPNQPVRVQLARPLKNGARVINISMGIACNADTLVAGRHAEGWVQAISDIISKWTGPQPLLVIAAGNHNQNAALSPGRLKSYGGVWDSVVVVVGASTARSDSLRSRWGGSNFTAGPDSGSNHGELIDLYAPGYQVNVWDDLASDFVTRTGTSYAAPHVSGIAALLFSFDPSLTAAEVKQLILQGAINGGRNHPGDR